MMNRLGSWWRNIVIVSAPHDHREGDRPPGGYGTCEACSSGIDAVRRHRTQCVECDAHNFFTQAQLDADDPLPCGVCGSTLGLMMVEVMGQVE